ncbi:MAG: preprotein translocase subunit YajC [Actinomycetota bacterium]|nr:preprotein translocase subunit YajC [Actinomycetota bacterium]
MNAALLFVGAANSNTNTNPLVTFLPLILIGVVFYFLLIRPQQRRARAQRELIQSVDVGDEVVTIGGLFGTVRAVDDDAITLEVAPGTTLRFVRSAIARKLNPDQEEEEPEGEEADESS